MEMIQRLIKLYKDTTGYECTGARELGASGSSRRYVRLYCESGKTLIGTIGTSVRENEAFFYLSNHFSEKGLSVPKVLGVSPDRLLYLQEDLGDFSLFDAIETDRSTSNFTPAEKELLIETISQLPDIQFKGARGLDFGKCYPVPEMDARSVMWDLNYFKYCFLKTAVKDFDEVRLENEFVRFSQILLEEKIDTFMFRDFQSRNVLIHDGKPFFIDFQGGRRGPFYYDVASFVGQARAAFPENLKIELIEAYIEALKPYLNITKEIFLARYRYFQLFRLLQVLGAYGFRGYFERKNHFLNSIPAALQNLRELLVIPFTELPYLSGLLQEISVSKKINSISAYESRLVVRVLSFSYKKGLPVDPSGNGGGYVFDCRALNNPGRYDEYKPLTGMDEPVKRFIEDKSSMSTFLEHVYALVDASVENYIERDFTSLTVAFGCTGGRHRSVYAAEHLAAHLHEKYAITVLLEHREQGITRNIDAL